MLFMTIKILYSVIHLKIDFLLRVSLNRSSASVLACRKTVAFNTSSYEACGCFQSIFIYANGKMFQESETFTV